jgi:hypothetical protein
MTNTRIRSAAILCLLAAFSIGLAQAQDEPDPLNRKLATRLIAEFFEIGESEIRLAYIIEGKVKRKDFETDRGAEVVYIRAVIEEGRRRRLVQNIRFLHDRVLGWFLQEIVQENGRNYIDICSEYEGRIRIE